MDRGAFPVSVSTCAGAASTGVVILLLISVRAQGLGSGRLSVVTRAMLSSRERQVVERLRAGANYKAIAHELRIAEGSARVHGARALRKLRSLKARG